MRVLVFGASITQGFWDTEGGWVGRLRKHYDELQLVDVLNNDEPTIFNLGVSGDTTKDLLARFENEVQARSWRGEDYAVIFSVGTNNAYKKDGKRFSTVKEYQQDLKDLVSSAKKYTSKVMMVGLPSCEEEITNPVPWADGISYANEDIKEVDGAMKAVCEQEDLPYINVFDDFESARKEGKKLFTDGIHPNNHGHELIFKKVLPRLDELLK